MKYILCFQDAIVQSFKFFWMTERIDFKEAAAMIGYTQRTFYKWCSKFGIGILRDPGFKKSYILKIEFDRAVDITANNYTQRKYGCSHEEITELMKFEVESKIAIELRKRKKQKCMIGYQPVGQHEKEFLASLTKINHEQ